MGAHTVALTVTDNGGVADDDLVQITVNPPAACTAGNTGWLNASSQTATAGGDGDGFETNANGAFTDGNGEAANLDGRDDRHLFYGFGISVPAGCSVKGIEVGIDWRLDDTAGASRMAVDLSWDGGGAWTRASSDSRETTTEHSATLGSATNTWRRTWTATRTTRR